MVSIFSCIWTYDQGKIMEGDIDRRASFYGKMREGNDEKGNMVMYMEGNIVDHRDVLLE